MWRYIFQRLLLLIPTLLGILAITFAIIQFVPGGPVEQMVQQLTQSSVGGETAAAATGTLMRSGSHLSADDMAALNALYGFDKPPLERFGDMVSRFARFDLGESFFHHQTVFELVKEKMPVSMSLGLWTFFLTYLICIPLGIIKAVRDGSRFDAATGMLILLGYTIPPFVLGLVLLVLLGAWLFLRASLPQLDGARQQAMQRRLVHWFAEEIIHADAKIAAAVFFAGVRRQGHDHQFLVAHGLVRPAAHADQSRRRGAIHLRHAQIHQDGGKFAGCTGGKSCQTGLAIAGCYR